MFKKTLIIALMAAGVFALSYTQALSASSSMNDQKIITAQADDGKLPPGTDDGNHTDKGGKE